MEDLIEYGRLLAMRDALGTATGWPLAMSPYDVVGLGAARARGRAGAASALLSAEAVYQQAAEALRGRRGFAAVSVGDTESYVLDGGSLAEDRIPVPLQAFLNAGYDLSSADALDAQRQTLMDAVRGADVIGVPASRHFDCQRLVLEALERVGVDVEHAPIADSTVFAAILAQGWLSRLLLGETRPVVAVVGNEAVRVGQALTEQGVAVGAVIAPVAGMAAWRDVVARLEGAQFDLALVGAGAASVPIASAIARRLGKVALDAGRQSDELALGLRDLTGRLADGPMSAEVTQFQLSVSAPVQIGYQDALTRLWPAGDRLSIGLGPGECAAVGLGLVEGRQRRLADPDEVLGALADAVALRRPFTYVSAQDGREEASILRLRPLPDVIGAPWKPDAPPAPLCAMRPRWAAANPVVASDFVYTRSGRGVCLYDILGSRRPRVRILLVVDHDSDFVRLLARHMGARVVRVSDDADARWPTVDDGDFDVALVSLGARTPASVMRLSRRTGRATLDARDLTRLVTFRVPHHLVWLGLGPRR